MRTSFTRRTIILGRAAAVLTLCGGVALAQQGGMMKEAIQEKLAAIKAAQAANKAALRTYAWTETVQFSLKGENRSTKQFLCSYGPDGQVVRQPAGQPQEQSREGPLRRRIQEKAKDEVEDFLGQVRTVVALYVPPDGAKMEQAFQAGNASLDRPGGGEAGLVFRNYAKPNDSMTLDFRTDTKKLAGLKVSSYLDDPSQPIALNVQFATLPDGTNYPATVVLDAPAKAMQVTMTNSGYQKRGP
jgi:hypothetical protein